jgi:hypothetical protein
MLDFLVNWLANVPVTALPYALAASGPAYSISPPKA